MSAGKTYEGPIQPDVLYTLDQAARLLHITPRLFKERWIYTGKLRFWDAGNRSWIIPGHTLIALANEELQTWKEPGTEDTTSE